MLQGYLIVGAAGLALGVGGFFYGRSVESDIQEARATKALLAQTEKTLETERKYQALSNEVEREIKPKLDAATARAGSLARSVRDYKERLRLSEMAGTPAESDAASRESADIAGLEQRHYEACERDATRLTEWQEWYRASKALLGE